MANWLESILKQASKQVALRAKITAEVSEKYSQPKYLKMDPIGRELLRSQELFTRIDKEIHSGYFASQK